MQVGARPPFSGGVICGTKLVGFDFMRVGDYILVLSRWLCRVLGSCSAERCLGSLSHNFQANFCTYDVNV